MRLLTILFNVIKLTWYKAQLMSLKALDAIEDSIEPPSNIKRQEPHWRTRGEFLRPPFVQEEKGFI